MTTEWHEAQLPAWMLGDEEALRILRSGLLEPMADLDALLRRAAGEDLRALLDPRQTREELVAALGALVGVGEDLPAARRTSQDDLRRYVASATRMWKGKGSRAALRLLVSAARGRTSLLLGWHDVRWVDGGTSSAALWHGPGVSSGSVYDDGPNVLDLWVMDPEEDLSLEDLAAWVHAAGRPSGRTVQLRRALFVDDHRNRSAWWTSDGAGTGGYDEDLRAVSADGRRWILDVDGSAAWSDYRWILVLGTTGEADLLAFASADGETAYVVRIAVDAGTIEVLRRVAGAETSLGSVSLPTSTTGYAYTYAVDVAVLTSSVEVRVLRSSAVVLTVADTSGSRIVSGAVGWEATTDAAYLYHSDVRPHGAALLTVGPPA